MRLHDFLAYWARERPHAEFALHGDRCLTYRQAQVATNRLANALAGAGLRRGDRIAVLAKNCLEYPLLYFGASKAGVVPVPLNYRAALAEWAYVVEDAGARLLIADPQLRAPVDARRGLLGTVERFLTLGEAAPPPGWESLHRVMAEQPAEGHQPAGEADDDLYQLYTSGTTGQPKGAVLTQRAVVANLIHTGAAPVAEQTLLAARAAFRCDVVQGYGLTEATAGLTAMAPADYEPGPTGQPGRLLSAGRPLLGTELRIVDAHGRPLPTGAVGEIVARGPQLMRGYWNRPAATAEVLRGGWLHTGDVGLLDAAGYLFIQDRLKDVIVTGGVNVYPRMVERVLLEHPAVADVAVIGTPDAHWGERVTAIVARRPGLTAGEPSEAELIDFCRGRLGSFQCPRAVDFVDALPRTATGKVLKRTLREAYWAGRERRVGAA
jgi:acyl-CoA synthetase (AMP-forming)/AMP-acid ligase II